MFFSARCTPRLCESPSVISSRVISETNVNAEILRVQEPSSDSAGMGAEGRPQVGGPKLGENANGMWKWMKSVVLGVAKDIKRWIKEDQWMIFL